MPELSFLYDLLQTLLPFEIMQMRFMQQALLGLLLLAPMVALMGVQVSISAWPFLPMRSVIRPLPALRWV